jgi:hypothetical protein
MVSLLPSQEAFVLPENDTQSLGNHVIAIAFKIFTELFEFENKLPVEFGLYTLANGLNLLGNVCRHGLPLSPGIYPAGNDESVGGSDLRAATASE